jgi:hypothetical protein
MYCPGIKGLFGKDFKEDWKKNSWKNIGALALSDTSIRLFKKELLWLLLI